MHFTQGQIISEIILIEIAAILRHVREQYRTSGHVEGVFTWLCFRIYDMAG